MGSSPTQRSSFVALIPFFAFQEVAEVVGSNALWDLFIKRDRRTFKLVRHKYERPVFRFICGDRGVFTASRIGAVGLLIPDSFSGMALNDSAMFASTMIQSCTAGRVAFITGQNPMRAPAS